MKQSRLDALADGIFAIVMTILVFEIRVPLHAGFISDRQLFTDIYNLYPLLLSYILSFSLLFTYWRSHHYIASVLAHNSDVKLSNLSAVFFLFVGLVPFSSHLLGLYSYSKVAITFFSLNIIFIGISLYIMRQYVIKSPNIRNESFTDIENKHANMRILVPVFSAIIAIIVAFFNPEVSMFLFTVAILYNLSRRSTKYTFHILKSIGLHKE